MKKIKLSEIRLDGGTQMRSELHQDKVTEYGHLMKDGVKFPPIKVVFDGSNYWLVDGFHRYFAIKGNGLVDVEVEVTNGTLNSAVWLAMGANKDHGIPATPEENMNKVRLIKLHPEWKEKTNVDIAKHIGISSMTVGRYIEKLGEKSTGKKVYQRDGKEVETTAEKLDRKREPKTTTPDSTTSTNKEIVRLQQLVEEQEQTIKEQADMIMTLADENTLLRDKIAIGQWDASEIEKIDAEERLSDLREHNKNLEIRLDAVTDSRNMYQDKNAELIKMINSLKKKLSKESK